MADEVWMGLAEAIGAIRAELQQAARDGAERGADRRIADDSGERPK